MNLFVVVLILLSIYAPWIFPVLFVLLFLVFLYAFSPALFWTLLVLLVLVCVRYEKSEYQTSSRRPTSD